MYDTIMTKMEMVVYQLSRKKLEEKEKEIYGDTSPPLLLQGT
jgi:hypothetical protein